MLSIKCPIKVLRSSLHNANTLTTSMHNGASTVGKTLQQMLLQAAQTLRIQVSWLPTIRLDQVVLTLLLLSIIAILINLLWDSAQTISANRVHDGPPATVRGAPRREQTEPPMSRSASHANKPTASRTAKQTNPLGLEEVIERFVSAQQKLELAKVKTTRLSNELAEAGKRVQRRQKALDDAQTKLVADSWKLEHRAEISNAVHQLSISRGVLVLRKDAYAKAVKEEDLAAAEHVHAEALYTRVAAASHPTTSASQV